MTAASSIPSGRSCASRRFSAGKFRIDDSSLIVPLSDSEARALAEAEERRRNAKPLDLPTELGGRDGPEPVRYGDYEKKGLCVDF